MSERSELRSTVLAGVDGSPQSTAAARWAAAEAVRRGASLRLVHAWPWLTDGVSSYAEPDDLPEAAQRTLAEAAEAVRARHPELAVQTDAVLDSPIDGLVAAAADAELLVLGSRGRGGFTGLLLGSVSMSVAGRSGVPVIVVREAVEAADGAGGAGEVVVGVDAHAPEEEVLAFAFREAALRGARVRAVHGWELPPLFGYAGGAVPAAEVEQSEALEAKLLSLALAGPRERHPQVAVVEDVRLGAARALVEASAGASLVVVGRRHRSFDLGPRLGRVAHAVLHHAEAPVAVVPHP
ncbi:nucleotide-binding universal stress UspA family protein [Streptomyces sp. 1114.5]|uniref:universal stress protein n=1 Tax=Streptomyces sp. 1114.5 TaxID=1938830 RepID=UPI000F1BD4FA|nr:universal stress protein [Streptomyces sp. 1114.5]RKT19602.1 nucleotide-binding universal stress UspA family protein [Streptomyces sp. 1114.5]